MAVPIVRTNLLRLRRSRKHAGSVSTWMAHASAMLAAFSAARQLNAAGHVDALSFGFVKNGGMGAEAVVFFDPEKADVARYRRKRAGHLQSKGRYLAAQVLAMLDGDLWLENARAANSAAQEIAGAAGGRLMHSVEANEIFLRCTADETQGAPIAGI